MESIYVALDLETTGLDRENDSILEIGAARFRGNEILETWSNLVDPGVDIPKQVQSLTGITPEMVQGQPTLAMLAPSLIRFVGGAPIVGHSIGFDVEFLRAHGIPLNNLTIDTFELASILLPRQGRYSLSALSESLGIDLVNAHRALDDAIASARLFQALLDYALDVPLPVVRQINRLAARTEWPLAPVFLGIERALARKRPTGKRRGTSSEPEDESLPLFEKARPLRPKDPPEPIDVDFAAMLLEQKGALSRIIEGYEYRPSQVTMLRAVAEAFNKEEHLMVEAGTGTGKSLAYLVPAALYAIANSARVVVSTNTINLQDQLFGKDLPALTEMLREAGMGEKPFLATMLKGRSNYICRRRLDNLLAHGDLSQQEMTTVARILVWLSHTRTGDKAELFLPSLSDQSVWARVETERESCIKDKCPYYLNRTCFFYNARRRAEKAHIVVVNHALLLADIATEQRVLPSYNHLIVDEAHHLEEAITKQMSFSTDWYKLRGLLDSMLHFSRSRDRRVSGLLPEVLERTQILPTKVYREIDATVSTVQDDVMRLRDRLGEFFDVLRESLREASGKQWNSTMYTRRIRITHSVRVQGTWDDVEMEWENVAALMRRIADAVRRLARGLADQELRDDPEMDGLIADLLSAAETLEETRSQLHSLIAEPNPGAVYWAEVTVPERGEVVSLHAAPLHIGPMVEEYLLGEKSTVVMTSATLRTAGKFDYIQDRLNAWEMKTLALESPFDYKSSTLLYLPTDMPEPQTPGYQRAVGKAILSLALATGGRLLALFTSYAQLRYTYNAVQTPLAEAGIILYSQGNGASRSQLLDNFRNTDKAVLFGTRSFWEGVDVVGPDLSVLVIARLPFDVPNDPIVSARSETFDSPFFQYAVPEAILRFRQGFGRLIRSKLDRGVVVVLDRRVTSKQYGKMFLDSLPECTVVRTPLADMPRRAADWLAKGNDTPRHRASA